MSNLHSVVFDHFREFAQANCPKLVHIDLIHKYTMRLAPQDRRYMVQIIVNGEKGQLYTIRDATHSQQSVIMLRVLMADPDSIMQIEEFLQEFNDNLP